MDCLTYRRLKLAVPQAASAAQLQHEQPCAACAAFARQIDAFERDLLEVRRCRCLTDSRSRSSSAFRNRDGSIGPISQWRRPLCWLWSRRSHSIWHLIATRWQKLLPRMWPRSLRSCASVGQLNRRNWWLLFRDTAAALQGPSAKFATSACARFWVLWPTTSWCRRNMVRPP